MRSIRGVAVAVLLAACSSSSGSGGNGGGSSSGGGGGTSTGSGGGSAAGGGSPQLYSNCMGDMISCSCVQKTVDNGEIIFGGCGDPVESLCCASMDWPATDHSSCSCDQNGKWQCLSDPAGFCWCGWANGVTATNPSATDITDGQSCWASGTTNGYDYCCMDSLSSAEPQCNCYNTAKWGPPPCPSGTTAVDTCLSSWHVPAPSFMQCSSTRKQVQTCELDNPPMKAGIGDPCTTNADCDSAQCSDPGGGYCTQGCNSHSECRGSHGGTNSFGGANFCVQKSSTTKICVPDCSTTASKCATQYGAGFDCITLNGVDLCLHP